MIDVYAQKKIEQIKACKSDEDMAEIINKIYEDGFSDGQEAE